MSQIDLEAIDAFAAHAHGSIDQRRKYTGAPYIEHPRSVASLVGNVGCGPLAVAVALLHDVVEDTPFTAADIHDRFGHEIADRVFQLTDEAPTPGRNRATRKAATIKRLARADAIVQSVKLADLIDNAASIVRHDPKFARLYVREMQDVLVVLTRGERRLQRAARLTLDGAQRTLERAA